VISADMFVSVNKKTAVHPLYKVGFSIVMNSLKRSDLIATDDHADIRGRLTRHIFLKRKPYRIITWKALD